MEKKLKIFIEKLEDTTGVKLIPIAKKVYKSYYNSRLLNFFRRRYDYLRILFYYIHSKKNQPIKLHLGCGERELDNYINIDLRKTKVTDYVADITKLPFPSGTAKEIVSFHVFEHLPRRQISKIIKNWHRILTDGGKLVIECPDFDKNIKDYLANNKPMIQLYYIFGRQRFPGDTHRFGYNFKRLKKLLINAGFNKVKKEKPQDYHRLEAGCLRVEAYK